MNEGSEPGDMAECPWWGMQGWEGRGECWGLLVFGGGRASLRRGEGVTWDPGVPGQGTQVPHCGALLSQQLNYPLLIKILALLEINPVPFTSQRLVLVLWLILMR